MSFAGYDQTHPLFRQPGIPEHPPRTTGGASARGGKQPYPARSL